MGLFQEDEEQEQYNMKQNGFQNKKEPINEEFLHDIYDNFSKVSATEQKEADAYAEAAAAESKAPKVTDVDANLWKEIFPDTSEDTAIFEEDNVTNETEEAVSEEIFSEEADGEAFDDTEEYESEEDLSDVFDEDEDSDSDDAYDEESEEDELEDSEEVDEDDEIEEIEIVSKEHLIPTEHHIPPEVVEVTKQAEKAMEEEKEKLVEKLATYEEFRNGRSVTITENVSRINGDIQSEGFVTIGSKTMVIGNVSGTYAYIAGKIKGNIDIKGDVILDATAVVEGNIRAKSISILKGAILNGYCSLQYAGVDTDKIFE